MHIAIDDTYGLAGNDNSKYVTRNRRTHLAVVFPDDQIDYIREEMRNSLDAFQKVSGTVAEEFHFVEIYNRTGSWKALKDSNSGLNIRIFEFFAEIYSQYQWPVLIQTVDDRTLNDHGIEYIDLKIEGLDLKKREDLSLFMLLAKIKDNYQSKNEPLTILIDEGREKPGKTFGNKVFRDWSGYSGMYQSSKSEPLLQIADFLAFCVNRTTHVILKDNRSDLDIWFCQLIASMRINCPDIRLSHLPKDFTTAQYDDLHKADRIEKKLEGSNSTIDSDATRQSFQS